MKIVYLCICSIFLSCPLEIRYMRRHHLVDVTEIFNQLNWEKKQRLFKLGYLIFILFISLFWYITKLSFNLYLLPILRIQAWNSHFCELFWTLRENCLLTYKWIFWWYLVEMISVMRSYLSNFLKKFRNKTLNLSTKRKLVLLIWEKIGYTTSQFIASELALINYLLLFL